MLVLVCIAGCGRPEFDLLAHPVQSGALPQPVPGSHTVVSLLDPADAFVCATHLSMWVEWERRHPGAWSLVLKRSPTAGEERMLKLFRLRPAAVLRNCRRCPAEPREYLLANGGVAQRETLAGGQFGSMLLLNAMNGRLAELARSGGRTAQVTRSNSLDRSSIQGAQP